MVGKLGEAVPSLSALALAWEFLMVADLPISLVTLFTVWKHETLTQLFILVGGTVWWYLIGVAIAGLFSRRGNEG
jgi:hypothetical protein